MKPTFISIRDLCVMLGIGRTKAYELVRDGHIQTAKIGRRRMVVRKSVCDFATQSIEEVN
jgi:excisionase family DNA binding protein